MKQLSKAIGKFKSGDLQVHALPTGIRVCDMLIYAYDFKFGKPLVNSPIRPIKSKNFPLYGIFVYQVLIVLQ